MYDSIYLRKETRESVYNRLTGLKETIGETGLVSYQGFVGNIRVKQDIMGITIAGSLSKFLHGNNISGLSRQDTKMAIEKLSDDLSTDIKKSNVYSLEIAHSFIMKYQVWEYLCCFGDLRFFKPMTIDNQSKEYFNKIRSLKFYDKISEMKDKKNPIPVEYKGTNLLRYEYKIQKRLKNIFNMPEVITENLYSEPFYFNALELWERLYFQIIKKKRIIFNWTKAMQNTKSFVEQLALIGIKSIGIQEVKQMIETSKRNVSRLQLSRIRKKLKELENVKSFTEPHEVIKELDYKINQSVLHYS